MGAPLTTTKFWNSEAVIKYIYSSIFGNSRRCLIFITNNVSIKSCYVQNSLPSCFAVRIYFLHNHIESGETISHLLFPLPLAKDQELPYLPLTSKWLWVHSFIFKNTFSKLLIYVRNYNTHWAQKDEYSLPPVRKLQIVYFGENKKITEYREK